MSIVGFKQIPILNLYWEKKNKSLLKLIENLFSFFK